VSPTLHESLRNLSPLVELKDRVNFLSVFEGLFLKGFGDRLTPAVRADLLAIGLDLDRLQSAYPHTVFLASLAVGAKHFFPNDPIPEAYAKLGARNMEGFFETFLGKPMLAMLKLVGPRRTLLRMRTNFRSANNYVESKVVEVSATEFQLWLNEPGDIRFFIQGVMRRGLELAGAKSLSLEVLASDAAGTVYHVKF
jgi:uncharacterized protein (TIGR02265 family)